MLDRFTVVNVQCQHLEEQLRPMLRHWVAHPKSVNQVGGWWAGAASLLMCARRGARRPWTFQELRTWNVGCTRHMTPGLEADFSA